MSILRQKRYKAWNHFIVLGISKFDTLIKLCAQMILFELKKSWYFKDNCCFKIHVYLCFYKNIYAHKYTQKHSCLCKPFSITDPQGDATWRFVPIIIPNYKLMTKLKVVLAHSFVVPSEVVLNKLCCMIW